MRPNLRPYYFLLSRFVLITLFGFTCIRHADAQSTIFSPASENPAFFYTLSEKYEKTYKQELATLPSKYKTDFERIYQQRWNHIRAKFDDQEIYPDPSAQQYMDALVEEIVKANTALQPLVFRCYFSRSGIPNASYIGHGIILINMGLFYHLNNESEAAFVIAHEIAHFMLKHNENAISSYVTFINSTEVQRQLRQIKKSAYKKREQLEKLVAGLTFSDRRHSRDHESEADSLAVELMRNTRFDITAAASALTILDHIDSDALNTEAFLEEIFNAPNYPFQKKWVAKDEGLLGGHARLKENDNIEDSLKTHPDCKLRISLLLPLINRRLQGSSARNIINQSKFEELKNNFPYEIIEYTFSAGHYTRSFYYALTLTKKRPFDPYLIAHTGIILNAIYAAQKAHTLGKVVDLPSPYYASSYNSLLQFVQNLYPENIASISYHFLSRYSSQLNNYDLFNKAYKTSIQIAQQ